MDLCDFAWLRHPVGLWIAFGVCHRLPCQLCLSQRLIHFNCTSECSREMRLDGLFCTYYCIRTFAFLEESMPCLKSACLSAHWLCLCCSLATVLLLPASISLQDLGLASAVPILFSAASVCCTPRLSFINFHTFTQTLICGHLHVNIHRS